VADPPQRGPGPSLIWAALAIMLLILGRRYGAPSLRDVLRLRPDVLRLIKRLAGGTDAGLRTVLHAVGLTHAD
jgi:hypothetical protein